MILTGPAGIRRRREAMRARAFATSPLPERLDPIARPPDEPEPPRAYGAVARGG